MRQSRYATIASAVGAFCERLAVRAFFCRFLRSLSVPLIVLHPGEICLPLDVNLPRGKVFLPN